MSKKDQNVPEARDDELLELEESQDDTVDEVDEPDLGELAEHLEGVGRDFEASEDYDDEDEVS